MNRRVAVVLGLTFGALVVATVWVPMDVWVKFETTDAVEWIPPQVPPWEPTAASANAWIWRVGDERFEGTDATYSMRLTVNWSALALRLVVVALLGGVLALFFRTRAAREAA